LSDLLISHRIRVVIVGMAMGGFAGIARGESANDLVDRLAKKREGVQSLYHVSRFITEEDKAKRESTLKVWRKKIGSVWKFRQTSSIDSEPKPSNKEKSPEITTVSDGQFEWREMKVADSLMVVKSKASTDAAADLNEVRERIKKGETKVGSADKVEGHACAVIEITGTENGDRFQSTYWISEEYGVVLRSRLRRAERSRHEMVTTEIKINDAIPDDKFAYVPPEGATVVDTETMGKPGDGKKKP
jgi:outer membrane lipoprotein-sorting protein